MIKNGTSRKFIDMKVIQDISESVLKGCCLTIGNFDGVHIGHQKILQTARQKADDKHTSLVVATFEPHPVAILHPEMTPERLATLQFKEKLLAENSADYLLLLKSDKNLLNLSARDFVEKILTKGIRPAVVVEGENFHFGAGRNGNIHTLTYLASEFGFEAVSVEQQSVKLSIGPSVKVSSTLIRNLLLEGKVADAAVALTRPYRLIGKVIAGRGKGKRLGFPTANLGQVNQLVPAEGVYAGTVQVGENEQAVCQTKDTIPAAFSIGRSATYGPDHPLSIEAHILSEVEDLTDKWTAFDFVEKIRNQQEFESEKALADQIAKDCQNAKNILNNRDL